MDICVYFMLALPCEELISCPMSRTGCVYDQEAAKEDDAGQRAEDP
jgi:hypothetical protein